MQVAAALFEENGHDLREYSFPQGLDPGEWADTLWMFDIVYELDRQIDRMGRQPETGEMEALTHYIREKVRSMSAMDHYHARLSAHRTSVKSMNSMADLDLLLTPALGGAPVPVGTLDSRTAAFDYQRWVTQGYQFAPFSYLCNVTGQPAASLPIWLSKDAPFSWRGIRGRTMLCCKPLR